MSRPSNHQPPDQAGSIGAPPPPPKPWLVAGVSLLLAFLTFAVFWPVTRCDFINLDDNAYFCTNPHILSGLNWDNVRWAFTTGYLGNWFPLTWLSFMLDVTLFGPGPRGPHLVNLLLHTLNGVLLLLLLHRMTGTLWRSVLVAALFALHPLRVESVAWVTERKDVLSGLFFLLTLWAYVCYAEGRRKKEECRMQNVESTSHPPCAVFYLLSLCLFGLGLMSKPMLVTVPLVLLLLDYWPLQRFQLNPANSKPGTFLPLLLEKVPFLLLSGIFSIVTVLAQSRAGAVPGLADLPLAARLQNALISYARYLGKTFWPVNLAIPYPPPHDWPWAAVAAAAVLLAGISLGALCYGRQRPYLLTGWFWWVGTLVPVIGLTQAGGQAMADRFSYLPAIGLLVALVWGASEWARPGRLCRVATAVGVVAIVIGLCLRTADQLRYWRNSETLFRHALACTSNNLAAHNSLGAALAAQERWEEAVQHYTVALRASPAFAAAHINLAQAFLALGKWDAAVRHCQLALQSAPHLTEPRINIASALLAQGKAEEAIRHCELALQSDPSLVAARVNLANALAAQGKWNDAIQHYKLALKSNPYLAEAHNGLGTVLAAQKRWPEAVQHFEAALQSGPTLVEVQNNLGRALAAQGKWPEAIERYRRALQIRPGSVEAHHGLADALLALGQGPRAIPHYQLALQSKPNLADAHSNLGLAFAQQGQWTNAIAHYQQALALQPTARSPRNNLAWLLATCPQAEFRNGTKAVELARELNRLSGGNDRDSLDTLAAAYAEAGQLPKAVEIACRALALAQAQTNAHLEEIRARLKLYQQGLPYHEPPPHP